MTKKVPCPEEKAKKVLCALEAPAALLDILAANHTTSTSTSASISIATATTTTTLPASSHQT